MDKSSNNTFSRSFLPITSVANGLGQEVTHDIYCLPVQIVNVCFIGNPHVSNEWVLIDAGMPHSAEQIEEEAKKRFGKEHRLKAVILTHGHFDHVGSLVNIIDDNDVSVYAHERELPYLTGKEHYPKGDPKVDGGLISEMSPLFPNHGIDLGGRVKALPKDGTVPELKGWQWMHTPGHTPGHISLFKEDDRSLIVGDAFVTVKQESLFKVITQEQEISGPPKYFTTDWNAAWHSVKELKALNPNIAITGHGFPLEGDRLRNDLDRLVKNFDKIAIPEDGRFVH